MQIADLICQHHAPSRPLFCRGATAALGWGLLMLMHAHAPAGVAAEKTREIAALRLVPEHSVLIGPDSVQQLAVDGVAPGQTAIDLTRQASFESSDERVAKVDATGLVSACGDGAATIVVRVGKLGTNVPVEVRHFAAAKPVHFANQIVPIFTKLGCNAGGCHGKSGGQNGFRLSLLGFEPTLDYETLVKEGRGRRLFPASPDASLLLQKATARAPHGGGKKLDPDSREFRLIRRWIASGMPVGKATDPTVAKITIEPAERILERGSSQQVVVTAHYSDGRTEDATPWAQYQSNETDVAAALTGGLVAAGRLPGQAGIMVRYQGQVAVFRATVPTGASVKALADFPASNRVDAAALKEWRTLQVVPAPLCTDAEFMRRASLDINGTLPSAGQVKAFIENSAADKRARLVDSLLGQPEYASFFAGKWADVLRNKREGRADLQAATFGFYDWIRECLARNEPYDRFVRAILAASGSAESSPPVQWYRKLRDTSAFVDDTAQVFLGMRLQCAKCHHHPFEKWSQGDYYGFAAFFARVGRKPDANAQRNGRDLEAIYTLRSGAVNHPRSGQVLAPQGLGAARIEVAPGDDPRQKLVDWLADARNPFFAKALVNRYWAHFFGRGIVEPVDDMRVTNPPSNPELLDVLADEFQKSGYDLKALIRLICTSRTYGLSSDAGASGSQDSQSFSRHYPRRMSAEVMLDALARVSGAPSAFDGLPAGTRAIELPDESVGSTFLDTFGRPKRETACQCERASDASLSQSLMLINSSDVQAKLSAQGGRAGELAADPRPDLEKLDELFWAALARAPTARETQTALAHVAKLAANKRVAYEDIIWALVNAKEFQFIN